MQLTRKPPANVDSAPITVEALKEAMPKRQKHNINSHLVDQLNALVTEPEEREAFRENLIGYTDILQDPNIKLKSYIEAVRYVSFKLMGYSNQESWMKTFPERYKRLVDSGKDPGFIRSTVACYNRNKIVNQILEQTLVPTYVLNADIFQKAVNEQARLMTTAASEKVRSDAANSLLTHLKPPEAVKMKLDVSVKQDTSIDELREATLELVKTQKQYIESGHTTAHDVAKGKLINGSCERVD